MNGVGATAKGWEGMLTAGVLLRSILAGQLGGRLECVGGGTAGSVVALECCNIDNLLELDVADAQRCQCSVLVLLTKWRMLALDRCREKAYN